MYTGLNKLSKHTNYQLKKTKLKNIKTSKESLNKSLNLHVPAQVLNKFYTLPVFKKKFNTFKVILSCLSL